MKIALAVGLGALALPAAAQATALTVPFIGFGLPPAANTIAGDETEYTISFVAQNGLSGGTTAVIVNAAGAPPLAAGTIFPPSALHDDEGAFYTIGTADDPGNVVVADVIRSNGNQTVVIPIAFTGLSASVNEVVTVGIGYASEHKVKNRLTFCDDCRLAIDTTMVGDDFGLTPTFDVNIGPGDLLKQAGDDQETAVDTAFGTNLQVKLVDGTGAAVASEDITFAAPATGASGTFADGNGLTDTVTTDAGGIATASVLTANDDVGAWTVAASVTDNNPAVAPVEFGLANEAGPPGAVDLTLDPTQITGDGVSTSRATAAVTDQFGNAVAAGQTVSFSSDDGQDISSTAELGGGIYRATITATPEPDLSTITVAVAEGSAPMDTAVLVQDVDAIAPVAKILQHPRARSRNKKARFSFDSNSADTDFFECKLDGAAFAQCSSPKTYRVSRGKHRFKVRATDFAGNTGPADSFKFERRKKRRR